ncbi:hypothetical protein [Maribacter hydrothermalis]|uniref:Uncharacterized protein n=1 Tax=Maribacter hydrothermalis TaxID=1836467 RepID=A0A1B7ZDW2_9FLAO|nr:hypothetical protein [Maribacter hydrothermalis]APQ16589.1 hypothetical protein BTR34_04235 [Maribacter hydrothermalis]OBR41506.1 hypothetical protein A9200_12800 [Maribacter hydrothermalis]
MKKYSFFLFILFSGSFIFGQEPIEWNSDFILQVEDYQSPESEINSELTFYSIYSGAKIDLSFNMNSVSFMFTKNFNDKVKAVFQKKLAVLIAPDSITAMQLVQFGRYDFDLVELYTRKIRKKIYEEKGAFSDSGLFQPIFNELQEEMNMVSAQVFKATDFGKDTELLQKEHDKVIDEINTLSDFCKACKPRKIRK